MPRVKDHEATEKAVLLWVAEEHLRYILRSRRINCVLDVGANTGQYGQLLRSLGYRGHIISFEPVPRFFRQLADNARDDRRWHVRRMALGRVSGSLEMHVVRGTLSSALPPSDYGRQLFQRLAKPPRIKQVPVRRLDEIFDSVVPKRIAQPRVLLKLDTQGYDLEAFAGLGDRIRDIVALQSEVALLGIYENMPMMTEALQTYRDAGFDITGMFPVSRDPETLRVIEYDCIMVRESSED